MALLRLERTAGWAAIAVAVGGVTYSLLFVLALKAHSSVAGTLSWLALLLGALLAIVVLAVLYLRLRTVDPVAALCALVLGIAGQYGAAAHAGFALATTGTTTDVPSEVDPRGLATFGLTGLAILLFSVLLRATDEVTAGLGVLGVVFGVLLVATYLGRLIIVNPNNLALLGLAAVTGLVVHPWWFIWLGRSWQAAGARITAASVDGPASPSHGGLPR
jgi:hypothetical protein